MQRPEPWAEGKKIPWNGPGFSCSMKREHRSREHAWASRRAIAWHMAGPARQAIDHELNKIWDRILSEYTKAFRKGEKSSTMTMEFLH